MQYLFYNIAVHNYYSLGHLYKISLTVLCCLLFVFAKSQFVITGTIYDSTKIVPVKDVVIKSSSGTMAVTDSNGRYSITATGRDSLVFIYQNKPTLKFAVSQVPNTGSFDISLHIRVAEKYRTLKEVKVYAKNHKQDSIENRQQYAKIFNYERPGIKLSSNSYSGAAGVDLDELINVFRFKRNKQLKKMQLRLEEEEKERYINYRFNKAIVRRITGLDGKDLDNFMKDYRPGYDFTLNSSLVQFYQYILNASYKYNEHKEKENYINTRFNRELVKMTTDLQEKDLGNFMKKYRPGYEFTYNSSPQQFYEYILIASNEFKQQLMPQNHSSNLPDSSNLPVQKD